MSAPPAFTVADIAARLHARLLGNDAAPITGLAAIDQAHAGNGYMPEAVVVVARFAFDELSLHRLQIAIIPRNTASRRVVEKLDLRMEGVAERYLQINGTWEDHCRYAITAEEWHKRRAELLWDWVDER